MMFCKCDGCGKEAPAITNGIDWFKPSSWYSRTPAGEKVAIQACSRRCIETVERKREEEGKQSSKVVIPI